MSGEQLRAEWRRREPIEVVKHGFFYSASVYVDVRPGSPYRAMFMSGVAIARGWGLSEQSAAKRCSSRREKVMAGDEAVYQDRKARTTHVNERDLR